MYTTSGGESEDRNISPRIALHDLHALGDRFAMIRVGECALPGVDQHCCEHRRPLDGEDATAVRSEHRRIGAKAGGGVDDGLTGRADRPGERLASGEPGAIRPVERPKQIDADAPSIECIGGVERDVAIANNERKSRIFRHLRAIDEQRATATGDAFGKGAAVGLGGLRDDAEAGIQGH
jgi:hypothetical protein